MFVVICVGRGGGQRKRCLSVNLLGELVKRVRVTLNTRERHCSLVKNECILRIFPYILQCFIAVPNMFFLGEALKNPAEILVWGPLKTPVEVTCSALGASSNKLCLFRSWRGCNPPKFFRPGDLLNCGLRGFLRGFHSFRPKILPISLRSRIRRW